MLAHERGSAAPGSPVGQNEEIAHAEAFLAERFGSGIKQVTRLRHGEWSTAYAFRRGGADFVVRFGALREDFDKDRWAARYASPDLPIPAVVEIGETPAGFYAISERVHGGFIDDLDGEGMRAVLPSLFATLDAARGVDLSTTSGYGSWGADGSAPHPTWRAALLDIGNDRPADRTHGWRERLAASPTGRGPFDEAAGLLMELVEYAPEERHLIHSDLLNFNVLVEGDRIGAVIDWGCAMYGDFLYDLAWFAYWSPWYPAWRGLDFKREAVRHYAAIGLDVPAFDERLRCCQIHIGLAAQAYNAFKERWAELAATAARTLAVAKAGR
jgi:hygromycin-B 4-O-kinase